MEDQLRRQNTNQNSNARTAAEKASSEKRDRKFQAQELEILGERETARTQTEREPEDWRSTCE
jgi:hypothetical protein